MICRLCNLEAGPHHMTDGDGVIHAPSGIGCDIAAHAVAGVFRDGVLPISQKLEEIRKELSSLFLREID